MHKLLILPLILGLASASFCQTSDADNFLLQGNFENAERLYLNYLNENPADSVVAYKLGRVYSGLKNWQKAEDFYNKSLEMNYPAGQVYYQKARNSILQNKMALAITYLQKGASAGMRNYIALTNDPLFNDLRDTAEWDEIIGIVEKNTYPCVTDPNHRHFDFWIGDWDVYRNGQKIGENRISKANGGCAIHESYTTYPRDYTGQSINYFDPNEQKWHQHWVGSGGDITNYLETGKGEGMLEFTANSKRAGQDILLRMTFTLQETGDVRQLIESSTDQGQTWSVGFDGLYVRKPEAN